LLCSLTVNYFIGPVQYSTELLNAMGVLDDLVTEDQIETGLSFQQKAIGYVSEIRSSIKSKFDSRNIKDWLESDRSATIGAAAGAIVGFLL
jgi:hypothetical protein